jgi:hypothetical protein
MSSAALASTIRPLCYEHHSEMSRVESASNRGRLEYGCREANCYVHYSMSRGYFVDGLSRNLIEQAPTPNVCCFRDGQSMYLLEVQPKQPSFRLWRCPQCNMSRIGGELP